ncbi:MAG: SulP family inorganic anion transporter [Burkholderiaceae bacterium]|nr:SulP family inorganic anion transporter [Burkholderiaceae bacterium]
MDKTVWQRWLPFLAWPRLRPNEWRGEFNAGLTVALLMVPQSVAYAALAGMPLVTGLYAALLPALVGVLWGASSRLSVGPTALTCLLVAASLTGMAEPGSAQWVDLAVWLAVLSGLLQLVMGVGGFGWLLNVISAPVLMGFTQAAALLIIASQLPALLGLKGPLASLLTGPMPDLRAAAFGLAGVALLLAARRWWPRLPMIVIVVGGAAGVSALLGFAAAGGAVIGTLPAGLPSLYVPHWPGLEALGQLVVPAMVIALVSFLETASSARVENQREGRRWDDNQDLIGQGLAKLAGAFSGTFAVSSSFSRSAVFMYAGARTGWASVVMVALVLLALLVLTPVLYHVPRAVLAGVVVVAVMNLVRPSAFAQLWRVARVEAVTAAVTFGVTLLTAPRIYWGVLAGVIMGLSHFLHHRLHPRIIEVGLHPDGSLRDRHLWQLPPLAPQLVALRMDAELDFAAASGFERAINEHLAARPDTRHVCLFAQPINRIDATGVETFSQLRRQLADRGITLHISGIKLPVERVLREAGQWPAGDPLLRAYRTDAEALAALARLHPDPPDLPAAAI